MDGRALAPRPRLPPRPVELQERMVAQQAATLLAQDRPLRSPPPPPVPRSAEGTDNSSADSDFLAPDSALTLEGTPLERDAGGAQATGLRVPSDRVGGAWSGRPGEEDERFELLAEISSHSIWEREGHPPILKLRQALRLVFRSEVIEHSAPHDVVSKVDGADVLASSAAQILHALQDSVTFTLGRKARRNTTRHSPPAPSGQVKSNEQKLHARHLLFRPYQRQDAVPEIWKTRALLNAIRSPTSPADRDAAMRLVIRMGMSCSCRDENDIEDSFWCMIVNELFAELDQGGNNNFGVIFDFLANSCLHCLYFSEEPVRNRQRLLGVVSALRVALENLGKRTQSSQGSWIAALKSTLLVCRLLHISSGSLTPFEPNKAVQSTWRNQSTPSVGLLLSPRVITQFAVRLGSRSLDLERLLVGNWFCEAVCEVSLEVGGSGYSSIESRNATLIARLYCNSRSWSTRRKVFRLLYRLACRRLGPSDDEDAEKQAALLLRCLEHHGGGETLIGLCWRLSRRLVLDLVRALFYDPDLWTNGDFSKRNTFDDFQTLINRYLDKTKVLRILIQIESIGEEWSRERENLTGTGAYDAECFSNKAKAETLAATETGVMEDAIEILRKAFLEVERRSEKADLNARTFAHLAYTSIAEQFIHLLVAPHLDCHGTTYDSELEYLLDVPVPISLPKGSRTGISLASDLLRTLGTRLSDPELENHEELHELDHTSRIRQSLVIVIGLSEHFECQPFVNDRDRGVASRAANFTVNSCEGPQLSVSRAAPDRRDLAERMWQVYRADSDKSLLSDVVRQSKLLG